MTFNKLTDLIDTLQLVIKDYHATIITCRDENIRLQAENKRLEKHIDTWQNQCDKLVKERDELLLEIEKLKGFNTQYMGVQCRPLEG